MLRERYLREMYDIRTELLRMGTLTERAFSQAMKALIRADLAAAGQVKPLEEEIDDFNQKIYDRCVRLISLQAPVAGDARYITGILEALVDIERISDYSDDIADIAFSLGGKTLPPLMKEFERMGENASAMLRISLDAWAHLDREQALTVRPMDDLVDADYLLLFDRLSMLISSPGDGTVPLNLVLASKYLERIADHAVNIAEQAAYAAPR